jgi:hypothetical protein
MTSVTSKPVIPAGDHGVGSWLAKLGENFPGDG